MDLLNYVGVLEVFKEGYLSNCGTGDSIVLLLEPNLLDGD